MEMLNRLWRIGFSVRQFLATFILAFIVLLVAQLLTFQNQISKNRDNAVLELSNSLEQTNLFLDYYVYSIQELLRTSIMRDDLFYNGSDVEKLLGEISEGMTGVRDVYTKQQDGEILCGNQLFYTILDNEAVRRHMEQSERRPDTILWSEPYYSRMQANRTMCIAYTDGKTGKVIAAEINLRTLYQNLNKTIRKNGESFVVTTKDQSVILFDTSDRSRIRTVKGIYPLEIQPGFLEDQDFAHPIHKLFPMSGNADYYGMYSNKNARGWNVLVIVDDSVLNHGVDDLKLNFLLSLAFGLTMVGAAVYLVVFYFTRPIRQLAETMESVRDLDTLKTIENHRIDEVGRLSECYNRLVLRIQRLVEDIKQSEQRRAAFEFRMHQSQIGPHFLRNTLYCIASLLRQERIGDAEVAIKSLAGLLSYSFDNSDPIVDLEQETGSLEKYIAIQKIRYGDSFFIDIKKNGDLQGCRVLKFILQPLVENAIIHGLPSVTEGEGRISIKIYRYFDFLIILVGDNGCGMSQEKADEAVKIKSDEYKKDRYSGIGIANIAERIRLHYGGNYGLRVFSRTGKGTIVRIKLPYLHN